eukprot:8532046-Pyramimonas_sp.AAC.1
MAHIGEAVHGDALKTGIVAEVDGNTVVTPPVTLRHFDLMTMKQPDVNFTADFKLELAPDAQPTVIYGVVIWFDVDFSKRVRHLNT